MPDTAPVTTLSPRDDAIIFDLDGVLTKTARVHAAAWKRRIDLPLGAPDDGLNVRTVHGLGNLKDQYFLEERFVSSGEQRPLAITINTTGGTTRTPNGERAARSDSPSGERKCDRKR